MTLLLLFVLRFFEFGGLLTGFGKAYVRISAHSAGHLKLN